MNHQEIIDAIDYSISTLCKKFQNQPTLFYTENDIVCYIYSILQEKLHFKEINDQDKKKHFLVHREYPTPFRCDMGENKFEIKDDEARTKNGGKYQRGHYDIVVLNPDFIKQKTYEEIKAQDYELYKNGVIDQIEKYKPIILYGIEFMYSRDPMKFSRGDKKEKGIDDFVAKIIQDADKLIASKEYNGLMDKIKVLVFVKGSKKEIQSLIKEKLIQRDEITVCFSG